MGLGPPFLHGVLCLLRHSLRLGNVPAPPSAAPGTHLVIRGIGVPVLPVIHVNDRGVPAVVSKEVPRSRLGALDPAAAAVEGHEVRGELVGRDAARVSVERHLSVLF